MPKTTTCKDHTPCPTDTDQWDLWSDKMMETHEQIRCDECGMWRIWEPIAPSKIDVVVVAHSKNMVTEMTREEWIEKAFELLNEMEADLWLLGESSEDAYTKAKIKFIDHITTQCPEE